MQIKINNNTRKILIFIIIIATIIFTYLVYNVVCNPGFEEQKNPVYSYSNNGDISYSVYLKPNKLYNESKLDEGKLYITEFVDYINTNIKYEFTGDRTAEIKGKYNVIAKVKGFNVESEKIIDIWEKDFTIIQNKLFNSKSGNISINEIVNINLYEYNTFVKEIIEASKINCQTVLTLMMNVNIEGFTDKGNFKESLSPSITIPLDVAMFEIMENNTGEKTGAIKETINVQLPINRILVLVYGAILSFIIISLIILIFFIKIAPAKEPLEKELKKIFKKHGDRLVAINSEIKINNSIIVKSIEDLVRIADEIEKPIIYKYSDDYREINKFYVSHDEEIYVLDLGYLIVSEPFEDTNDNTSKNTSE